MTYEYNSPNYKNYLNYMERVFRNLGITGEGNDRYRNFNKLLGWKETDWLIVDFGDPDKRRTIELLAGPHGKTLLKIIELRKQQNDGN